MGEEEVWRITETLMGAIGVGECGGEGGEDRTGEGGGTGAIPPSAASCGTPLEAGEEKVRRCPNHQHPDCKLSCVSLIVIRKYGPLRNRLCQIQKHIYKKGPRDLGKYKISSDYWGKKLSITILFNFVKVVRNIDISKLEPKTIKCSFC